MSKWAISGLAMVVLGAVLLGFQKISGLMGGDGGWDALCLVDLILPDHLNWIDGVTFLGLNRLLDMLVLAPLYLLLLCVGGICLLVSGFLKN